MMQPHPSSVINNAIWALPTIIIPHGDERIMLESPYFVFKPQRFIVDPICAPFYIITDMMFGNHIMIDNPVAASCFPPLPPKFAEMSDEDKEAVKRYIDKITFPTLTPAHRIRLIVKHRGMCPWHSDCNAIPGMANESCKAPPFNSYFQGISQTYP